MNPEDDFYQFANLLTDGQVRTDVANVVSKVLLGLAIAMLIIGVIL